MRRFLVGFLFMASAISADADFREFGEVPTDQRLEAALKSTVETTLKEFPKLTADNLAISVVDLTKPDCDGPIITVTLHFIPLRW
jgi:hypothetical protein